ncbi:MAG: oxidoreductase [Rhodobiaceae bacterium]|nr:oxidoreductase [Rhodobiaceae bacterium]MCC0054608.1 oxidoreductase [Rhodobiaceae bacterium]
MTGETIDVRINQMRYEAATIVSLELVPVDGGDLPAFTAGAHIDLILTDKIRRSYSLLNDQGERDRYVVGIHRDPDSRGGSRIVHERLRVGQVIKISPPVNDFPLDESARHIVLLAGGIGVTPILCMLRRLQAEGKSWELHYGARNSTAAAFLSEIKEIAKDDPSRIHMFFDDENPGKYIDIPAIVAAQPDDAHFYCCGPVPMLDAYEKATKDLPRERVHMEYFSAKEEVAREGGFDLVLQKSGKHITVPPGKTILDVLIENKVNVSFSCSEGICGTCETAVIEGVPDHRDQFLTDEEKASNKLIMVCCSGAKSAKLVLDL